MRASATQIETFRTCARKWALTKIMRLPVITTGSQAKGTVLHSVGERYASADDLGRDRKTGQPVDLYPPGWEQAKSRFDEEQIDGTATLSDQETIKTLITAAIEAGVLERTPGRVIEHPFTIENAIEDVHIDGFIDLADWALGLVQDHKTTNNMRWAKSPAALKSNVQMIIYAYVAASKADLPQYTLRHNVFCMNPGDLRVRKTEVTITKEEILKEWELIREDLQKMKSIKERGITRWSDIPDPPRMDLACNMYGGCPFRDVCSGRESELGYKEKIEIFLDKQKGISKDTKTLQADNSATTGAIMPTFAEVLAAKKAAALGNAGNMSATVTPVQPASVAGAVALSPGPTLPTQSVIPTPVALQTAPAPQPGGIDPLSVVPANQPISKPPWHYPDCVACSHTPGFSTSGHPCRICDGKAAQRGLDTSDNYTQRNVDGMCYWVYNKNPSIAGVSVRRRPEVKAEEKVTAPAQTAPVETQATPVPAVQSPPGWPSGAEWPPAMGTPLTPEQAAYIPAAFQSFYPRAVPAPVAAPVAAPAPAVANAIAALAGHWENAVVATLKTTPPAAEPTAPAQAAEAKGRAKKGFVLLVNCAPIKGQGKSGRGVQYLHERYLATCAEIATGQKVDHYLDLDPFKRRELFAPHAEAICEEFGTDMVVATGIYTPDYRAFFEAIRPFAGMEIVGFAE